VWCWWCGGASAVSGGSASAGSGGDGATVVMATTVLFDLIMIYLIFHNFGQVKIATCSMMRIIYT
jgi:hypothetical protein